MSVFTRINPHCLWTSWYEKLKILKLMALKLWRGWKYVCNLLDLPQGDVQSYQFIRNIYGKVSVDNWGYDMSLCLTIMLNRKSIPNPFSMTKFYLLSICSKILLKQLKQILKKEYEKYFSQLINLSRAPWVFVWRTNT